ncbi:MAG: sigma-70 family RNA polymerase sigma factor [Oscillibacter sp.]|jgi:RNA polymerase sigma factor, sigma-70 family|nr:sigma-70 family RNA polymerase sigma factor [Oscillibacter sp.]MDY4907437.1 sigma-70 family RNA polymerase sigma factor [Oscillospiraceae bacterium]
MLSNEAFAQTAEKYMDTVFRVAYGWLKNPDDANDVAQDVLVELYKTDKAFESDAHLKNWLIRVTVNRCKMFFRSPWRRHEDIDDYAETLSFEQPRDGELFEAVMALGSVAYASDLGGIQRTVQLWLNGEMTDATLTVNEGSYTMRYPDKDGTEHEMGGGGIAIEDDGTERALTEEELFEHLNEPEVEEREDGTVTVYYLDQKLDVTDKFNEDGVCYVQLEGGEKTIYMTIKRGNGYATSTTKYILPSEFNN